MHEKKEREGERDQYNIERESFTLIPDSSHRYAWSADTIINSENDTAKNSNNFKSDDLHQVARKTKL